MSAEATKDVTYRRREAAPGGIPALPHLAGRDRGGSHRAKLDDPERQVRQRAEPHQLGDQNGHHEEGPAEGPA